MSPATRLSAELWKTIFVPSAEKTASALSPLACPPTKFVETRVIAPLTRSLMKMSDTPLVSPATRLPAALENSSFVPSGESTGSSLSPLPCAPEPDVETRLTEIVAPASAMTGASLTAVMKTVVVGALLAWLADWPSSTVQVTVRVVLAPEASGVSPVFEKVTERSAAWYWATVAVPVSVSTWVPAL